MEDYLSSPFFQKAKLLTADSGGQLENLVGQPTYVEITKDLKQQWHGLIYSISKHNGRSLQGWRTVELIIAPWLKFLQSDCDSQVLGPGPSSTIVDIATSSFKRMGIMILISVD